MCTTTESDKNSSSNMKKQTNSKDGGDSESTLEAAHSEQELSHDQSSWSWWRCRKNPGPSSGRDLGVWERSLEDRANCLSSWSMAYLDPLLRLGSHKVLEADDIGVPSAEDQAEHAFVTAKQAWDDQTRKCEVKNAEAMKKYEAKLAAATSDVEKEKIKKPTLSEPSVALALVNSFGAWRIVLALIYYVISALLNFLPVLILNDLVRYFENDSHDTYVPPYAEVILLGCIPLLVSLLQTRHSVIMAHCAVFARTSVSTLLYRKSLTVSAAGRAKTSTGQVVNMMSNDTAQLQRFLQFGGMTLVAPIQIIISLVLIYGQV
jgi:uncharacterized membrane protein